MIELHVITRAALAEPWLPWCVSRRAPDHVLAIDHDPTRRDEARQLRVGAVEEETTRRALRNNKGNDSLSYIEALAADLKVLSQRGTLVLAARPPLRPDDWPKAFSLPEGPMLHEACHRACALYVGNIEPFELRLLVEPLEWFLYDHPALRA